jgi:uncharacterized membrane protein
MSDPTATRFVIGPNASLTRRGAVFAFAWIAFVAFGIAGFFTLLGFWPILPFAGLEVGAFAAALWISLRRNRYREVLNFDGRLARIEFGLAGRAERSVVEFPQAWIRAAIESGPHRNSPTRLVLSCHGQRIEVGRCLTDEERETLVARISAVTGSAWQQEGRGVFAAGVMNGLQ